MEHLKTKQCTCGAWIVFLETKNGKLMPCDAESVRITDRLYDSERHVSHFGTCPKTSKFKNKES